ncbi:hypothetical protein NCCP2331_32540 [Sporosarcina sp. NCCP-2331]|nr:hypothetical protein NCCP2331_32540 [Sporosarcina sp. NCCP-2331]GLB57424.1 hypothetical protein NCCP2378_32120 [Sporosarcina sp. NCCP-2378]
MRQLEGAKRPSWLTAGPPERVRLKRRETVSLHLPYPLQSQSNLKLQTVKHTFW